MPSYTNDSVDTPTTRIHCDPSGRRPFRTIDGPTQMTIVSRRFRFESCRLETKRERNLIPVTLTSGAGCLNCHDLQVVDSDHWSGLGFKPNCKKILPFGFSLSG